MSNPSTCRSARWILLASLIAAPACRCGPTPAGGDDAAAAADANAGELRAGAQILVTYRGAKDAPPTIKRSRDEALRLARDLVAQLRRDPRRFSKLAAQHSDVAAALKTGHLGVWHRGQMVPLFERAFDKLRVDEVAAPVESEFGYHVLMRLPVPPPHPIAASQILVSYRGAKRAGPKVTRSKEDARALAEKTASQVRAQPTRFAELAQQLSDGPTAAAGGRLPVWIRGRPQLPLDLTEPVERLRVGQLSPVIETAHGFNILRREPVPPALNGSHILIAYRGARGAGSDVVRNEAQARQIAEQLAEQLARDPKRFAELVARRSDCPSKQRGGSLGAWYEGRMLPAFDRAVSALKEGEISKPIETPFGFHIVRRDPLPDRR